MIAAQTQGYRISFELTKPNRLCWYHEADHQLYQLRLDPELIKHVHVKV